MLKRAIILIFLLYLFIPNGALAVKISIPPSQGYNGQAVIVPVNIDHAVALGGFQMTITYDAAVLQATGALAGDISSNPQWVLVVDTSTPGQITVAAYDSLLKGPVVLSGGLVRLKFNVIGDMGTSSSLNITSTKLSDIYGKGIPAAASPGHFYTDTDGDGIPDTIDNCPSFFPVRIASTDYSTLQSAYDAATNGAVIRSQDEVLVGDFNLAVNKSVTLEAGHNCDYSINTGTTRLKGSMTIRSGQLTISSGVLSVE